MPTNAVKNHSFRRYLFLLIASFIVVLVTFQLWFFNYIQTQIKQEIQQRSAALSNVAVKVASKNLLLARKTDPDTSEIATSTIAPAQTYHDGPRDSVIRIIITDTPNKEVDLGGGYRFITGEQTQTAQISYGEDADTSLDELHQRESQQGEIREEQFARQVELAHLDQYVTGDIEFSTIGDAFQLAVAAPEHNIVSRHIVQFDEASVIDQYFNWLMIITVLLMLLGVAYALWLAGTISRPLESLAEGFKGLEKGEYGKQVTVQGIDDMQRTMVQFNHMSSKLQALKEMEKQLSQQQQLLELNEVTRGLAHTLRNPLNTIGLAIEEIADANVTDQQKQQLAEKVRDKIFRLDQTIKTMLSMNVQDVDRTQDTDLVAVIQDIILEFAFSFAGKIHFESVSHIKLLGAHTELRAIVHTLVANAVEATIAHMGSKDAETGDIHVIAQQEGQLVTVTVIDEGKGIASHIKPDLFKPHVSDKPEGAGMGLFIANRICQSYYQGNIRLEDNTPNGCIASVTFGTGKQPEEQPEEE